MAEQRLIRHRALSPNRPSSLREPRNFRESKSNSLFSTLSSSSFLTQGLRYCCILNSLLFYKLKAAKAVAHPPSYLNSNPNNRTLKKRKDQPPKMADPTQTPDLSEKAVEAANDFFAQLYSFFELVITRFCTNSYKSIADMSGKRLDKSNRQRGLLHPGASLHRKGL